LFSTFRCKSVSANSQEIDYLGTDTHLHQICNNGSWGAGDLTVAAGASMPAQGSTLSTHFDTITGSQELNFLGSDQHVHQLWFDGNAWHESDLTASIGGSLAANGSPIVSAKNPLGLTSEIDYIGTDHHIHQYWFSAGTWHAADITALSSGALTASDSQLTTAFNTIAQRQEISYLGQESTHIPSLA